VPRARDRGDAPGRSNPGPAAGRALARAGGVADPAGGHHGHHEQAAARAHTLPRHTLQVSKQLALPFLKVPKCEILISWILKILYLEVSIGKGTRGLK
jgi:hypothetical protein